MNLSYLKVNCSSIGALMASPKDNYPPTEKEWKDFFNVINKEKEKISERQIFLIKELVQKQISYSPDKLSETIKKEMAKIYAYEEYGMSSLNGGGARSLVIDKGNLAEEESIKLLSRIDGKEYVKNEVLISNRFFKGIPDILEFNFKKKPVKAIDVKTSYDLPAFLCRLNEPCETKNVWQMNGYLDILKIESGEVVHVLVDMPPKMAEAEADRVMQQCQLLDMEEAEIERRLLNLRMSMSYQSIPEELRVIRYKITHNELKSKDARAKVKLLRKYVKELDAKFKKL